MATMTARQEGGQKPANMDGTASSIISDYDIHYSFSEKPHTSPHTSKVVTVAGYVRREAQPDGFDPTLAPHPLVPYSVSNPNWWQKAYRRVPDYRPVNKNLDREQRRQSPLFQAVGWFMIAGCSMIANWSSIWRNTAGRFTDIGIGQVGGEF
ncbi:uncharacterized protein N7469_002103 [Penicillium citrinum]|uniref:Uncharacterized protein n=1 Tax=Penicillium citrinum TaxID=5077 RepID=A0A9W9P9W6_PENCI|nr:uncharacterized protein N7469_002103 [Penicillium citrinum]KAJ5240512.1 hypothetical protein N7469_002103 [Penicillium citrinum]